MIELKGIPRDRIVSLYMEDMELQGYIVAHNGKEILIACVDRYGENDGFGVLKKNHIYRLDYDSFYEKKLESLYVLKKQTHKDLRIPDTCSSLREALLLWAYQERKIATFLLADNEDISGYIETLDKCRIKIVDEFACKPDLGYTCVDLAAADAILVDTRKARDSELIYQYRGDADV